jgi:hypothetical protein
MARKGKVKTATAQERAYVDFVLDTALEEYEIQLREMRQSMGDYIRVRTFYFDKEGKFLSSDKARELRRKGESVSRKRVFYTRVDLPEFDLKAGDKIPDELFEGVMDNVREKVRYHNTIVGVALAHGISFDEAKEMVDKYLELWEKGELSWEEVHEIFSP